MLRDQSVPVGLGAIRARPTITFSGRTRLRASGVINRHCGAPVYFLADIASVPTDEKHSRFFHRVPQ